MLKCSWFAVAAAVVRKAAKAAIKNQKKVRKATKAIKVTEEAAAVVGKQKK